MADLQYEAQIRARITQLRLAKNVSEHRMSLDLRQHRTIWQEHSAKDFASYESYKRAGILYVFPPFITARMGQKIGRSPQTQLCGDALAHVKEKQTKWEFPLAVLFAVEDISFVTIAKLPGNGSRRFGGG